MDAKTNAALVGPRFCFKFLSAILIAASLAAAGKEFLVFNPRE
jgi:hypothetical protein